MVFLFAAVPIGAFSWWDSDLDEHSSTLGGIAMKRICSLIALFAVSFGQAQVTCADDFIQLNLYGAHTEGAAFTKDGFGANAGLRFPDGASSELELGFVLPLPPDYIAGDKIRIGLAWHTDAATPCDAELRPNSVSVARFGRTHIQGGSASAGLAPQDGTSVLAATQTNVTYLKIYLITPPDGTTTLGPGDIVNFGLYRPTDGSQDNCAGDLVIQGAAVLLGG